MPKKWPAVKLIRLAILALPSLVLLWLMNQYFSLFGELRFSYDFSGESPFVSEFTPAGRALDRSKNLRTGESSQSIVGDPVYLHVAVPRSFNEVAVEVEYRNSGQPLVELGLVTSVLPWSIRLEPFENRVVDQAMLEWNRLESNGVTVLQREPVAASVDEFLARLPEMGRVGTYRYSPTVAYQDPSYQAQAGGLELTQLLRGQHEFVTYAANETLHFEFDLVDSNREFNEDPLKVEVYQGDILVHEELLPDDGIAEATGLPSATRQLTVDLPVGEPAVYRLVVAVNDDIFLTRVQTEQEKLIIPRRLFLAQSSEYASTIAGLTTTASNLHFQGDKLVAKTDHAAGLQTLAFNDSGEEFAIDLISAPQIWEEAEDADPRSRRLTVPNNDLLLTTSGFFAFSESSFFDPQFGLRPIDETITLDELDAILVADYEPPIQEDGSSRQTTHFSLDGVAGDRKDLQFVLSAPGIDRYHQTIAVDAIHFTFTREPLLTRLQNRFFP